MSEPMEPGQESEAEEVARQIQAMQDMQVHLVDDYVFTHELRIRELEVAAAYDEAQIAVLKQRIATAKEILEQGRRHVAETARYTDYGRITKTALAALEGK